MHVGVFSLEGVVQRKGCKDYNVNCKAWAEQGEVRCRACFGGVHCAFFSSYAQCERNPQYMIGTDNQGDCIRSCKACQG